MTTLAPAHEPDEILLGFARALRSAGVAVTHDRATSFLEAVSLVGVDDPRAVFVAGQATLCASPDDLVRFGHVFEAWFGARERLPRRVAAEHPRRIRAPLPVGEQGEVGGSVKDIRSGDQVDADATAWEPPTQDLRPQIIRAES